MGALFIVFAVSMAAATFIENDYGSAYAYASVYRAKWFEIILLLLAVNLAGQIILLKLLRKNKLPVALFHLAFILMLAGAAITRYAGWEGTISIREGASENSVYSAEKYVGLSVENGSGGIVESKHKRFLLETSNSKGYSESFEVDGNEYNLTFDKVVFNAEESLTDSPGGEPMISLFMGSSMGESETVLLKGGEIAQYGPVTIGFLSDEQTDIRIYTDSGAFFMSSPSQISVMSMMTRESTITEPGTPVELKTMQLINFGSIRLVPQKMSAEGKAIAVQSENTEQGTGKNALLFTLMGNGKTENITLWSDLSQPLTEESLQIGNNNITVTYGSKQVELPFSLKLNDFILERYPGSSSPSGYKSLVTLNDNAQSTSFDAEIYMNNILKYHGYRFYQSSFDSDEMGTVLSVSHDQAGMYITYAGYALLFLFIVLALISRHSQFRTITAGAWVSALRKGAAILIFALIGTGSLSAQKLIAEPKGANEFGKVLVQDQKGRTKPLFTLSNDIIRKVVRENKYGEYTPMQVFLGLYLDFPSWKDEPLIKISNPDLQKMIGVAGNYAAFADIVDIDGTGNYKLAGVVNEAYAKAPAERSKLDKEIMKVDERVNIVYMVYKGDFMKVFPLRDSTHNWGTWQDALVTAKNNEDSLYLSNIIPLLADALSSGNSATAIQISQSVAEYQKMFGGYVLPSDSRTGAELLYYRMAIFEKLFPFYSTVGLVMLIMLIVSVIRGSSQKSVIIKVLGYLLFTGFLFHTFGLGLRWYISGHSPMSNGYESLLFISWVTIIAGFIFSRKSFFAMAATAVLAGMSLMVAHLSFMDPEITNLVPVLQSYWLTLHVSVITGSYGFLGMGAIIGLIVMILTALSNNKNRMTIAATIDELTVINFKTMVLGLYFLTIGTFLGAVWANESWGRYWGWDPKETWSLITIIVYTLVTHSRMIPGMKDIFTFNLLSLFAFSSVLMTYFGVNYYLSGLHSYASGDPVPVPVFVYIAVFLLAALSVYAKVKYNSYSKSR